MSITPAHLTQYAGTAAITAGLIFVGVQIGHPHLDAESITTTEMAVRGTLKLVMAVLALAGLTGMYLRQVRQAGVLGLIGYLVYALGYLLISGTAFAATFILPSVAETDPGLVDDVVAVNSGGQPDGDVGLFAVVNTVQSAGYLLGGLLFGIALYRAGVLSRWASVLLAISGLVTVALSVLPDAFYRLLAFPNGIAMVGLGWSLWQLGRRDRDAEPQASEPQLTAVGAA